MARPRMGDAAKKLMRRTGADALADAVSAGPVWKRGAGNNQAGYKVTTLRLAPNQWKWLRQMAHARALESGAKADASEIVRELVAEAMKRKK